MNQYQVFFLLYFKFFAFFLASWVDVPADDSAGVFDEKDKSPQRPGVCALIILSDFAILIFLYAKRLRKTANPAQIILPNGIIYC